MARIERCNPEERAFANDRFIAFGLTCRPAGTGGSDSLEDIPAVSDEFIASKIQGRVLVKLSEV